MRWYKVVFCVTLHLWPLPQKADFMLSDRAELLSGSLSEAAGLSLRLRAACLSHLCDRETAHKTEYSPLHMLQQSPEKHSTDGRLPFITSSFWTSCNTSLEVSYSIQTWCITAPSPQSVWAGPVPHGSAPRKQHLRHHQIKRSAHLKTNPVIKKPLLFLISIQITIWSHQS